MPRYSLTCFNKSSQPGSFMVFQDLPPSSPPNSVSLAWLVSSVPQNGQTTLQWTLDYLFYWSQNDTLRPGITVVPSQTLPADPNGANSVTFDMRGAPYLGNVERARQPGMLTIRQSGAIPRGRFAVGIGMSGAPSFADAAFPNMATVFEAAPSYRLAFGNFQPGQVLDRPGISGAVAVSYAGGVTTQTATLQPDGIISIG